ncbi:MAG: M3 family oligoendopeptidase [Candidatus Dojkabacteria bacterium]|jgi:oligoendopeptidase F
MVWNTEILYKGMSDPQIERDIETAQRKNALFVSKWTKDQRYLNNPRVLLSALTEYEELQRRYGQCTKPYYYFYLLNSLDQTDTDIKARLNQISEIATKLENQIQFFELNISKVDEDQQKKFLKSPLLRNYKHYLERLFAVSKYLLSDKEEQVFNLTSKTSHSNWVNMVSELLDKQKIEVKDENNKKIEISYNEISRFLDSKDRKVRDYAAKQYNQVNGKYLEIAEFEMNSILENKKIADEYRGVSRPDLTRYIGDDMDTEVIDMVAKVVTENFDIPQKYYVLKAKQLNQRKLKYYERNVPIGDIHLEYSYDEGMDLVKRTFKNLDKSFLEVVEKFERNGQYDVYPREGKSGGGFCVTVSNDLPTYILLNHTNKLNDVLTIAHESGHGIHSEFSRTQSELNSGHPTSLAEVASTFFEDFVLEEILKDSSDDVKHTVMYQKMNNDISTIFRQIAFLNFEKELHEKFRSNGYLSKEHISDLFVKHMKAYMGDVVTDDDSMRYGWIYVSHFRRFFYVYSYATGLLISKALQSMVKEDKRNIALVKKFLSAGSTKSPKEIFKDMGIDITKKEFWLKGIKEIERNFDCYSKV